LALTAGSKKLMSYVKKLIRPNLRSQPKRKADFIEPMDCAPVTELADGPGWLYEVLCGGPHKISSVAMNVMWR